MISKRRREATLHRKIARDEREAVISQLLEDGRSRLTSADLTCVIANNSIEVLRAHAASADMNLDSDHLTLAVERNSFAVFKWAVRRKAAHHAVAGWEGEEEWLEAAHHMPLLAARYGHTGMLEWMLVGECKELFDEGYPDHCLCEEAASNEHWGTLLFLIDHGMRQLRFAERRCVLSRIVDERFAEYESSIMPLRAQGMQRMREDIRVALDEYPLREDF